MFNPESTNHDYNKDMSLEDCLLAAIEPENEAM